MEIPIWIPFQSEWWTFFMILASIPILIYISELTLKLKVLSPESNRRLVHFFVGILITISPFIFSEYLLPSILALIFLVVNYFAYHNEKLPGIHSQERVTYGTIYFPLGYLIMTIGFWEYSEFVIISLAILAVADPVAAMIGENISKDNEFVIWKDKKTIQGTITFYSISFFLILLLGKLLLQFPNSYLFCFALFSAIGSTVAEITSCKGSDNLSIPIISVLFMMGFIERATPNQNDFFTILSSPFLIKILCLSFIFYIAYKFKTLSLDGFLGALLMGVIIILIGSKHFFMLLAIFFILSSILSKILKKASFYRTKGSQRDIIQVYANGGIAFLLSIIYFLNNDSVYIYLFASSVAAAMSDTWGTEFGKLSKHKPISITSLKSTDHGISGGITRIGTLGSLLGSSIIGFSTWVMIPIPTHIIYGIILSGFLSSLFDSILGDVFQGKYKNQSGEIIEVKEKDSLLIKGYSWINNDLVNLLNTIFSPLILYFFILLY
ncbi:MAG: DUF92 domain-containing protein [Candidatus Neomarinimicrobiota bacterium]